MTKRGWDDRGDGNDRERWDDKRGRNPLQCRGLIGEDDVTNLVGVCGAGGGNIVYSF